MEKVIISAAITGMGLVSKDVSPHIPNTVEEVTEEAFRAYEAGASIVHLHAIDPLTGKPAPDPNTIMREYIKAIRERCDVLINVTTGGGRRLTPAQEAAGLTVDDVIHEKIQLGQDISSLNMATMNRWRYPPASDGIFHNPTTLIEKFAKWMKEYGVRPEMEVWTMNDVTLSGIMLQREIFEEPLNYQFVMSGGVGMPATAKAVLYCVESIPKNVRAEWGAFGIGRNQMPMAALSAVMGGNIRVGFDDNIYAAYKVLAKSNEELVAKAVRIAKEVGREIAEVEDVRERLAIRKKT